MMSQAELEEKVLALVKQGMTPEDAVVEVATTIIAQLFIANAITRLLLIDYIKERHGLPRRIKWQG